MTKSNLLFLCTGNSCRSQMAEAFLRDYAGDRFEVFSAGLQPTEINPWTYKVMAEKGLHLDGHYAKNVAEYKGAIEFDTVITVCDDANELCPVYLGRASRRLHWGFEDPAKFTGSDEDTLVKFREVREAIDTCIRSWLENEN